MPKAAGTSGFFYFAGNCIYFENEHKCHSLFLCLNAKKGGFRKRMIPDLTHHMKGDLKFMNYNNFETAIKDRIQELVPPEVSVKPDTITRNNQTEHHGLLFEKSNSNIAPRIYLDAYYQAFQTGSSLNKITADIFALFQQIKDTPDFDIQKAFSFENIKDKIVYRLINYKQNKETLTQIPYIRFHDLAIVFYIQFDIADSANASCAITNAHLDLWDKTTNEIYTHAQQNTRRIFPFSLIPMDSFLLNMLSFCEGIDSSELQKLMTPGFEILTNTNKLFGAACILYDHVLELIGMKLQENYYIIPSSTHEVLILRESDAKHIPSLSYMIQDVNSEAVADEDVLTDHPYYYDCSTGILQVA